MGERTRFVVLCFYQRAAQAGNTHTHTQTRSHMHTCIFACLHTQTLLPLPHIHTHTHDMVIYCDRLFFFTDGNISVSRNQTKIMINKSNQIKMESPECYNLCIFFVSMFPAQRSGLTATTLNRAERGTSGASQLIFKTARLR